MARAKKRKTEYSKPEAVTPGAAASEPIPPPVPAPKNNPFADMAGALKATVKPAAAPSAPAAAIPKRGSASAPSASRPAGRDRGGLGAEPPGENSQEHENRLFRDAMNDVKALPDESRVRVRPQAPPPTSAPLYDEDAEALAKLAAMMDGAEPLGHEFSEEHTEWIAEDVDAGILPRLVGGEFAYQAHVDLHGRTREQAREAVFRFLADARIRQYRCVLIVHGRGNHSEGQVSILKPSLQRWLRRGALKAWVFAYATARPVDGGAGAMYVMLRKP